MRTTVPLLLVIAGAASLKANSWQARLDKATLGVDVDAKARVRLFQRVVRDPALQKDVKRAVTAVRMQGMGKGHPKLIELLWPTGTTARADIESLFALQQQVPELVQELGQQLRDGPLLLKALSGFAPPNAPDTLSSIVGLASDSAKQAALGEEIKDLARRTPKGLETPKYRVTMTLEGPPFLNKPELIEVRRYAEFTVARTGTDGSRSASNGEGFNTLASYLFGRNEPGTAMAMTMPVETTAGSQGSGSMAFVLPKQYAGAPPAPLDGDEITIATVPARLVAVKAFGGIATNGEIERQKTSLLEVLAKQPTLAPVDETQASVLQYNSPLTVPWRRRNEVAIIVEEVRVKEGTATIVSSWYDSGTRLR